MKRSPTELCLSALILFLVAAFIPACGGEGGGDDDVIVIDPGNVAGDFQSLAFYLADPVVKDILARMPRYSGDDPPDMSGSYESTGNVVSSSFVSKNTPVVADFCFGPSPPGGGLLAVVVKDGSVVDAGAKSFIEGEGDFFTVYTAFKSVQLDDTRATCEIHEVNIFSGRRNVDGSVSDLYIGQGIVGVLGPCSSSLFPGDYQISLNIANRVGDDCEGNPGTGPVNPANVLVEVENQLVVETLVFRDDETVPRLLVPALGAKSLELAPGFSLYIESLQPVAGQDDQDRDLLMGEIVAAQFPTDTTPAGDIITYSMENEVGTDVYFAPLPLNQTRADIFSVVNIGVNLPWYPPLPGGLDCQCSMAPSIDPYIIGYYSYSLPGLLDPAQTGVRFFKVENETVTYKNFNGPFALDTSSGTVTLLVQ